jgi:hypothetical protein
LIFSQINSTTRARPTRIKACPDAQVLSHNSHRDDDKPRQRLKRKTSGPAVPGKP